VISESADFLYKTTDYYSPEHEQAILWSDSSLNIAWPLEGLTPQVSDKDLQAQVFSSAQFFS
jgi:dTDP-4-dehydrorhamnose 3,5-epimerase